MRKLTLSNAREFALGKFKQLPELYFQWNVLHSEGIIRLLKLMDPDKKFNMDKLYALAWVHDIGKIKSEEGHAEASLDILKQEFELDEIDRDCILNHGSSAKPKTEEGELFRYADGLSLFTPQMVNFKFYAEAKEGLSFVEIMEELKRIYEKYKLKYSESKQAIKLLKELFETNVSL